MVAAGCGGLGGGLADGPGTPSETLTPAPVPTPTPTPVDRDVAPGIRGGAVDDLDELAAAHRSIVRNRSYTWRDRLIVERRTEGSTAVSRRNQTVYYENPTTYLRVTSREVRQVGSRERIFPGYERYANGSTMFTRWASFEGEGAEYVRGPVRPTRGRFARLATGTVRRYLDEGSAEVETVVANGSRAYAVTVTRDQLPTVDAVRYRARAVVTPEGFVRSLSVGYVGETQGGNAQVAGSYSFDYGAVDRTTVEPPAWLDAARDTTSGTGVFP